MPTYEFACPQCKAEFDVILKISEYDTSVVECETCNVQAVREIRTPISYEIPYNMQAAPNYDKKEKSRVPINFIDEKPDGSYRVTRVGSKADINND